MKNIKKLRLLEIAGYHNDRREFSRLVLSSQISMSKAVKQWHQGLIARSKGMACGCDKCSKGEKS